MGRSCDSFVHCLEHKWALREVLIHFLICWLFLLTCILKLHYDSLTDNGGEKGIQLTLGLEVV